MAYWKVTSSSFYTTACTDSGDWLSELEPPAVEENTYLTYLVAEDGTIATAQDCKTTLASSCSRYRRIRTSRCSIGRLAM